MRREMTRGEIRDEETVREKPEPRYEQVRAMSMALYEEMRPYIEKRQPGPMAVYVR